MISISAPEEIGSISTAHHESALQEHSTYMKDEKIGFFPTETEHASTDPARHASESAAIESSKGRHVLCSSISDPGKRLNAAAFLQPCSASSQGKPTLRATRIVISDHTIRDERQYGLSTSDMASGLKIGDWRSCQSSPHNPSGFTHDLVSLAVKQRDLVYLATFAQVGRYLARSAPCHHASTGEGCHDLQGLARLTAALCGSMVVTHAAGSNNPDQRSSTTSRAQGSTTGNELAARSEYFMNTQPTGLGSGDDGEDPDDHDKRFKPARGHEIDTADGGRKLMLDVCARFHQQSHLQRSSDSESGREEDEDRSRYARGRTCSCSNIATRRFTVGPAQRGGSAPAQVQYHQEIDRGGSNAENDTSPRSDDGHLRQAPICRPRMVRASVITGEPNVDAPWMHHMRPSSLLELRRGAEGYGGYGGLASLPDAHRSSRAENERIAPETELGAHGPNATHHQADINRDSFSFRRSVSSISQHVALTEEPMEEAVDGRSHDQSSVISQNTALVEGPPEELISTYALQDRGLLEALFADTPTNLETSEHVECSEPRRPSVPHMTPQVPLDSSSTDELSTYTKPQAGSIRPGIRQRCTERGRQGSSWSSVLCCLGNGEHEQHTSPEKERSSSGTTRFRNGTLQNTNQNRIASDNHVEGRHSPGLGQGYMPTEALQETSGRSTEPAPAVMDTLTTSEKVPESEPDPQVTVTSTKCPRTRFAEINERWRDPTARS